LIALFSKKNPQFFSSSEEKFHTVHYKSGVLVTKHQDVRVHVTENDKLKSSKSTPLSISKSAKKATSKYQSSSSTPFDNNHLSSTDSVIDEEKETCEFVEPQDKKSSDRSENTQNCGKSSGIGLFSTLEVKGHFYGAMKIRRIPIRRISIYTKSTIGRISVLPNS